MSYKTIVKESTIHGRGLFAATNISQGDIILTNILLLYESGSVSESISRYAFDYNGMNIEGLAMGDISFCNHSVSPNCSYYIGEFDQIVIVAERDIKQDEELLINYGYDPSDEP